ncbi:MAG: long-chain fatty acid--CoA ligase, partial [Acidimicrobiaceae bacterium]|nr:long-chain fatty acid--CoA ligase [Acidimicrobiaceae bacterium]
MIGGGTIIMQDRFDPALMMRTVAEEQINLWGGVPTIFQICVAHPDFADADLSSVEHIAWGGAAMPFELIQQLLAKTGASRASTGYGSTETIGGVVFSGPDDSAELATTTVGFIADQTELRLVDDKGNDVAQGEQGEMLVRCDFLMKEYWNRPEATAAAIDSDGWYRTGDLLRQRDDGRYVFLGRNSDMFKSGGYNVYPREIEDCLEEHPAVALAAVVGVPDELFQEVGHAHVVLSGDAAPDAIIEHVRSHLANYKVPKAVFVHEQLPMLAVGKVDKVALRATSAPGGHDG